MESAITPRSKPAIVRAIIDSDEPLVRPGVFDPLSAKLVEAAGFKAATISGFALTASMGLCDVGVISFGEMLNRAREIAQAVDIPIIADGDTGYGNYLNVTRCVRELELAGLAGVTLGDGLTPQNRTGRPIVSQGEMVSKLNAAVEARQNPAFFISARTDAAPTFGVDATIERVRAYAATGIDAFTALDVREIDDMKRMIEAVDLPATGVISLAHPPVLSVPELTAIGFKVIVPSVPALFAAVKSMWEVLLTLRETGSLESVRSSLAETKFITDLLELPRLREMETQYLGIKDGYTAF